MTSRETLYRLIDRLPADLLPEVEQYLQSLQADPVLRAFAGATVAAQPLTPAEVVQIEEGEAELARGETVPWKIVAARLFGGIP